MPTAPGAAGQAAGRGPARVPRRGLVSAAEDPVFGGGACRVRGCDRAARSEDCARATTSAGSTRAARTWTVFAATASPVAPAAPERRLLGAPAAGTRGGRMGQCTGSGGTAPGEPDLHGWLADPPTIDDPAPAWSARWRTASCGRRRRCRSAPPTQHLEGQRATGDRASSSLLRAGAVDRPLRLRPLGGRPQLKLEIQYVLQCRHDSGGPQDPCRVVMPVVRARPPAGAVLAAGPDRARSGRTRRGSGARHGAIGQLRSGRRPPQRWRTCRRRRLGERVPGPRRLASCAARVRPAASGSVRPHRRSRGCAIWPNGGCAGGSGPELGLEAAGAAGCAPDPVPAALAVGVDALRRRRPGRAGALPGRPARRLAGRQRHGDRTSARSTRSCTRSASNAGTTRCPARAVFYPEDYPARTERPPRALAEQVMAQVEHPDNLDRLAQPRPPAAPRLILMRCGLRVTDALRSRRLRRPRRRGRPLPALLQPQDETRGAGPDRRGSRAAHRANSSSGSWTVARREHRACFPDRAR